jgi:dTDP-4-amino-4,6-dideoxygalactose transaminase
VTASAEFILGRRVEQFEHEFARFVECEYAIGVGSGLDALRLALLALEVGPGDEVIVPANTYIATALAVTDVGADVVLVDCNPRTYNVDPGVVEAAVTQRTRAVIPVHFAGQAAEMTGLIDVARRHGLVVIEDAAQAHGARHDGRACGSIGDVGCFSFYPGKNLGAYGDGGIVTTHDPEIADRIRLFRNYGERRKYDHVVKGVNSRLDGLQAAFLTVKLRHLKGWNEARLELAGRYAAQLHGVGDLVIQPRGSSSTHVYHLFVVETAHRDDLREFLTKREIQTGIHYPKPIHLHEAYSELALDVGSFPEAERLARESLSLPMFPELTPEQVDGVTGAIRDFFDRL